MELIKKLKHILTLEPNQGTNQPRAMLRLAKDGRFDEMSARYRQQAERSNITEVHRFNLLGLSHLYQLEPDLAIPYFQKALDGAIGRDANTVGNSLAVAYLQKGWFDRAMGIMVEHRNSGRVTIATYILALLANGKREEARNFYELHPLPQQSGVRHGIELLLQFDPRNPQSLDAASGVMKDPIMRMYGLSIPKLLEQWDIEVFFETADRYEALSEECVSLIEGCDQDPALFQSKLLRYMRSLLVLVSTNTSTYQGCIEMYALLRNIDEMANDLPITEETRKDFSKFWRRLYYIIDHTASPYETDMSAADEWVKRQLPPDAKAIDTFSQRCSFYVAPDIKKGIRVLRALYPDQRIYAELTPWEDAEKTASLLAPVAAILNNDESTRHIIEPLIFQITCDCTSVTVDSLRDVMFRLPGHHRSDLEEALAILV